MYLVICTVMVIITVLILKDTHVTVYYNGYSRSVALIEEDYDLKVPVWLVFSNTNPRIYPSTEHYAIHSRIFILYSSCCVESR
jgi:hypothetical protein